MTLFSFDSNKDQDKSEGKDIRNMTRAGIKYDCFVTRTKQA